MFDSAKILTENYTDACAFLLENGYVQINGVLDRKGIDEFQTACELVKKKPTPFKIHRKNKNGEFFMDFNNWRRFDSVLNICKKPEIVQLVKVLSGSKKCYLMHEDIIIKEGNLVQETPPHHDRPYFVTKGDLNLSIWITSSGVSRDSSLLMYSKSHKDNKLYLPKNFLSGLDTEGYKGLDRSLFHPLDENVLAQYEEVDFEMDAGDAIVFFHNTIHSSKKHVSEKKRSSLVIRYLLDGASLTKKYYNNVPPYERLGLKVEEDLPINEDFFPRVG